MNKLLIHQKCLEIVESSILAIKLAIQEAQDAANNETKSSAGDKHETARAMAQLETEKLFTQLNEALKLSQVFAQLNPNQKNKQITIGSLVFTNNGYFYIAVSLGKIEVEQETIPQQNGFPKNKIHFGCGITQTKHPHQGVAAKSEYIYVISPVSPIGKLLLTKKEKDSFSLNGINYVIERIS